VGLGAVVGGRVAVTGAVLGGELLRSRIGDVRAPQRGGHHALGRLLRHAREIGQREPRPAAGQHLGGDPALAKLRHQGHGVPGIAGHEDDLGLQRL
jgi:hypothetical protein